MAKRRCRLPIFDVIPFSPLKKVDSEFKTRDTRFLPGRGKFPTVGKILGKSAFIFFVACLASVFAQIETATGKFDEGCPVAL